MSDIAIVHDYLSQYGGAERVALALADMFDAPIYTSIYQPERTFDDFRHRDIRTTFLQRFVPDGRFRWTAPALGRAFRSLDLSSFDRVIVSSSGFAHHIEHPNASIYCHTTPRFIYDLDQYFSNSGALRSATQPFLPWLRRADKRAADSHQHYVANSSVTARRLADIYGKSTGVIHPPLHTQHLPAVALDPPAEPRALVVARLQPYKRIDLAIEACAIAGVPLTIAGTGLDESRLRAVAKGDVTFLGRVLDEDLAGLFSDHSVVLVPGVEDFGLAPVEANYAGRPVVARAAGGALETMTAGVTGTLVDGDDPAEWAKALRDTLNNRWSTSGLRESTVRFQLPAFEASIKSWLDQA